MEKIMIQTLRMLLIATLSCACTQAATIEPVAAGLKLIEPFGVAFDRGGALYICEYKGEKITRLDRAGKATLFAGTGEASYGGDGGPASQAALRDPHGLVIGPGEVMYIADTLNHRIRKVDLKTGVISTFAGTGTAGFSGDGGPAAKAAFNGVFAIALNPPGDKLYIADLSNRRIRMIVLKTGIVTSIAGNGTDGIPSDGAAAAESPLQDPRAVAADSQGNVYILERRGNALRVVDKHGKIRTVIKPGSISPNMNGPKHLCVDKKGNVIIADAENHLIRKYSPRDGSTVTIAGTGQKGDHIEPGDPLKTQLNRPHGVFVHSSGDLYITDSYNHRIVKMRNWQ
jgi:sugar lactone lactonase YvrE